MTGAGLLWQTPEALDDGEALLASVCALGLEGIVAKPSPIGTYPGAPLDHDEEPRLLALRDRARKLAQITSARVHLSATA